MPRRRTLPAPSIERPGFRRPGAPSAQATPVVARRTSSSVARSGARASGAGSGSSEPPSELQKRSAEYRLASVGRPAPRPGSAGGPHLIHGHAAGSTF